MFKMNDLVHMTVKLYGSSFEGLASMLPTLASDRDKDF